MFLSVVKNIQIIKHHVESAIMFTNKLQSLCMKITGKLLAYFIPPRIMR